MVPEDVEPILRWENDMDNWESSNTFVPYTKKEIEEFVHSDQDIYMGRQMRFMICLNDSFLPIGCIDLFDFEPEHQRVCIGVLIGEREERNKGYAREALSCLINYCREVLEIHQVFCNILTDNISSIRLFKSMDFKPVGIKKDWVRTHNAWKDEEMYQLIIN